MDAAGPNTDRHRYDVFVSYSSLDRTWVEQELLTRLRRAALTVILDDDFQPGRFSVQNMADAIRLSRHTLLVITPAWVESVWCDFEGNLVQTLDPAGRDGRLVPLLVQPCELPFQLKSHTLLDLTRPRTYAAKLDGLVNELANRPPAGPAAGPALATSPVERPTALVSGTGVDYTALDTALAERKWAQADELTLRLMGQAGAPERSAAGLTIRELSTFPCADLQLVDRLWVYHSGGKFGFSVQRRARQIADNNREQFGDAIGWRRNGLWIAWPDVTFDIGAPDGHLPIGGHTGLCSATTAITAGRGASGFIESQIEIAKSGVADLFHPGGFGRFGKRVKAELSMKDGFALWWMKGREELLRRLGACAIHG